MACRFWQELHSSLSVRSSYRWIAIAATDAASRTTANGRFPQSPLRICIATAASTIMALAIAPTRDVTGIYRSKPTTTSTTPDTR